MTNLEAIKAKVSYPLSDNAFILALTNRGLISSSAYSTANIQAMELAYADMLIVLISSPDISEGGYKVSLSDKATLQKLASSIYRKWGVKDISSPTAQFINPW